MVFNVFGFLQSTQGRKITYYGINTLAIGYMVGKFSAHTFLMDSYINMFGAYKDGEPIKVNAEIQECFDTAQKHAQLEDYQIGAVRPFISFGFDMFSLGSFRSYFGGSIGIPHNFLFDAKTIRKEKIQVIGKLLDYSKSEANDFADSLALSKNAKIFAITRELEFMKSFLFYDIFIKPVFFVTFYRAGSSICDRANLRTKPAGIRLIFYTMVALLGSATYFLLRDSYQVYLDETVDRELAKRHPDLRAGGEEFYEKQLQRNKALKVFYNDKDSKVYTDLGNEVNRIRQTHLPALSRKEFFVQEN